MNPQELIDLKQRILRLGLHKVEEEALYDQVRQAVNRPTSKRPVPHRRKKKSLPRVRRLVKH